LTPSGAHTTNPEKALAYYTETVGYKVRSHDMGEHGKYHLLAAGPYEVGGLCGMMPGEPPRSYWLSYIAADDVDASAKKAGSLGGQVVMPPMDIPDVGRFAVVLDPTGAVFALFKGFPKTR
jgi:hypothetical protein